MLEDNPFISFCCKPQESELSLLLTITSSLGFLIVRVAELLREIHCGCCL